MFPQEAGRYHIYVGNTCPWCHRAVLAVVLRGLAPGVTFSYMDDSEFFVWIIYLFHLIISANAESS